MAALSFIEDHIKHYKSTENIDLSLLLRLVCDHILNCNRLQGGSDHPKAIAFIQLFVNLFSKLVVETHESKLVSEINIGDLLVVLMSII